MEIIETLNNSHVSVVFNSSKEIPIRGSDHDDKNNYPAFFTQNKRGSVKQWNILKSQFNEKTTFSEVFWILSDNGAKIHQWCSMD